jgi:uncharacterized DUF497 family protein
MYFTWDDSKCRSNRTKHGISFEVAMLVFEDPHALSTIDRVVDGEERWHTIGLAGGVVVVLVVHTWFEQYGEEAIRIISARKATLQERNLYEEAF